MFEVLVAIALTIGLILTTTSAVVNALHGAAVADLRMSLNDDALNALIDIRTVSEYDKTMLSKLNGRAAIMTRKSSNGGTETISVSIAAAPSVDSAAAAHAAGSPILVATATVSQGGVTVIQSQNIFWEAPAPGSSVDQQ